MNRDRKITWLEILIGTAVSLGFIVAILLDQSRAQAQSSGGKSGFLPGSRPIGKGAGAAAPGKSKPIERSTAQQNPNRNFFDDDDDDDDDLDMGMGMAPPPSFQQPRGAHIAKHAAPAHPSSAQNTISVGGAPNTVPDPIITDQGVSIGGGNPNGVITKNKTAPFKLNEETGEGSKAMITDFNYPDADIVDLAKTMGKLTGKNFILDKDVKGKITVISNAPITMGAAWKAFLTALDINGFALIPSGDFLRIARQRDARDKQLNTYTGDHSPDTDALITRVFQLKYISAEEVARTFRNFVPANSRIIPYEQTNTVIVTDTGSNIAKLSKMLDILDVEGYDAGIEVIPVKYASASELSKLIDALVPGTASAPSGGGPPGVPRFGGGGSRFNARRTKEGGIINTIIADERTNTLIVHANTKGADQVRELVTKLDQKLPTSTGGGKVHVVYLQFADAEQLANTLNNFSSQATGKGAAPTPAGGTGTGTNPIATTLFEGAIRISPDKATNALVINASPSDFVTVKRVIDRLDIPRDQIYVEVVIMEVGISRNFSYSSNIAQFTAGNPAGVGLITNSDLQNFITSPITQQGALFSLAAGGSSTFNIGGQSFTIGSVQALIKAIQSNTNANILATPQIVALDNSEANFESAEKIPVSAGTTIAGNGLSQQNITKEPVVLSMTIKPQINKATRFVKLDVTTKLGDVSNANVPPGLAGTTFGTLERTAKTSVVVGDSDTIVLGGLIRDKVTDSVSKIPILGDIPLLGWLFKSKTSQVQKSNLLIFMTPHILRPYEKIRAILDKKLKDRDDFIETNAGGEDPERKVRDDIIRSLPDIKDLQKPPQTTYTIDEEEKPAATPVFPQGEPPINNGASNHPANQPASQAEIKKDKPTTPVLDPGTASPAGASLMEASPGAPTTAPISPGGAENHPDSASPAVKQ